MADKNCSSFQGMFSKFGFGVALGLAIIVCTAIVSVTAIKMMEVDNSIQVKGYAERKITSESAVWRGTIRAHNTNLTQAYQSLETSQKQTVELLKKNGFENILLGQIVKQDIHKKTPDGKNITNEIEGYRLQQTIEVTSDDVNKTSTLPTSINSLNLQGHDIDSGAIQYYYPSDKLDKLKVELLSEASKSAKMRADQFAINSGSKIGKLLNARQGVFQVTAPNSSDISDYGAYDTSSIAKVVKIVVTMTYGID